MRKQRKKATFLQQQHGDQEGVRKEKNIYNIDKVYIIPHNLLNLLLNGNLKANCKAKT